MRRPAPLLAGGAGMASLLAPDLALVRNAFQLRSMLEVPAVRHAAEAMPRARLESFLAAHEDLLTRTPGLEVTPEAADFKRLGQGSRGAGLKKLRSGEVSGARTFWFGGEWRRTNPAGTSPPSTARLFIRRRDRLPADA